MKVVKVTSKGQVTIPSEVRTSLGIDEGSYLEVTEEGEEIRLRKVVPARPLSGDDRSGASLARAGAVSETSHPSTTGIWLRERFERWRESS